jgi:TonB family protein
MENIINFIAVTVRTMKTDVYLSLGRMIFIVFLFSLNPFILTSQNITPPQCYGGNRLMREFIREEMVYPQTALREKTEGTVIVSFTVHSDGSASDYKIKQSLSDATDAEALRICRFIQWFPAKDLGRPVEYVHNMEFRFDINKYNNMVKDRGYDQVIYPFTPVDTGNLVYALIDLENSPKPVYSSRDYNFSSFISNHLDYPETAFKQNISGTVKLKFIVEVSGRISNILIEKAVGAGCTEEAIRVVKLIKWNPGILHGKAVRTWMGLEITFDIARRSVSGTIPDPGQVH